MPLTGALPFNEDGRATTRRAAGPAPAPEVNSPAVFQSSASLTARAWDGDSMSAEATGVSPYTSHPAKRARSALSQGATEQSASEQQATAPNEQAAEPATRMGSSDMPTSAAADGVQRSVAAPPVAANAVTARTRLVLHGSTGTVAASGLPPLAADITNELINYCLVSIRAAKEQSVARCPLAFARSMR